MTYIFSVLLGFFFFRLYLVRRGEWLLLLVDVGPKADGSKSDTTELLWVGEITVGSKSFQGISC